LKNDEVESMLENILANGHNPNLKAGKIEDKSLYFEAEITTRDSSLVDKLLVDKDIGRIRPVY
jgi:hypothetical protein